MNFSNLFQDPMVVLELVAIISTFFIIVKLTFLDSVSNSVRNSVKENLREFDRKCQQRILPTTSYQTAEKDSDSLIDFFTVGSLISLPKYCLTQQSLHPRTLYSQRA